MQDVAVVILALSLGAIVAIAFLDATNSPIVKSPTGRYKYEVAVDDCVPANYIYI